MATMSYRFAPRSLPPPQDPRVRIAVFGAAGATGQLAVRHALAAGHRVTAFLAEPAHWALSHDDLTLVHADPLVPQSLQGVLAGHDAVLCLVGHRPESALQRDAGRRAPLAALATRHLVAAMSEEGVSRMVLMGAAGVGNSVAAGVLGIGRWLQWLLPEVMADKERQEALVRGSALRWTVVRPARLSHAPASGHIHVGENLRWGWRGIPREDIAALMVRLVDDPSAIGKVFTVA
jgi:putative NADH-flavin reductase